VGSFIRRRANRIRPSFELEKPLDGVTCPDVHPRTESRPHARHRAFRLAVTTAKPNAPFILPQDIATILETPACAADIRTISGTVLVFSEWQD
jgi:hypothetical protein